MAQRHEKEQGDHHRARSIKPRQDIVLAQHVARAAEDVRTKDVEQPDLYEFIEFRQFVHREDAVNADALRDLVEVDVARLAQRADHVHSAMTTALPAVEPSAGDLDIAIAGDRFCRVHDTALKCG